MKRQPYPTKSVFLRAEQQRALAIAALMTAPLDEMRPLHFRLGEEVKLRKPDQNSLMWSGPLKDIAEQAYVGGRTFSETIWHEYFKREYLPEEFSEELTKAVYRKWDFDPAGNRILVGSSKDLTVRGFAQYLEKVIAHGAGLGVMFNMKEAA